MIQVKNVDKSFGQLQVLKNINCYVAPVKWCVLLVPAAPAKAPC
jgi:ABC-type polar amino acid transport system ATPase subunit